MLMSSSFLISYILIYYYVRHQRVYKGEEATHVLLTQLELLVFYINKI